MNPFADINGLDDLASLVALIAVLAPGFWISFLRGRFVTGRKASISQAAFEYVLFSAVYYSIAAPIFFSLGNFSWTSLSVLVFFVPMALGVVAGAAYQWCLFEPLYRVIKLNPVHPAPTSWDYRFSSLRGGCWVVVTLRNYQEVYGYFGRRSFAASDLDRRDLYIEDIRNEHWDRVEPDGRPRGLWITSDEIVMVEIIPDEDGKYV